MRISLKQYDKLENYIIDSERGSGATCIVYNAHYKDGAGMPHKVLIKECFPYDCEIERDTSTGKLLWRNTDEKSMAIADFGKKYAQMTNLQSNSDIQDSIAHTINYFEENNTAYSVTDFNYGQTFDQMFGCSLFDILQIMKNLAEIVGKYHEVGYLHLDVKPENFLVTETTNRVVLFDVDSVVKILDVKEHKINDFLHTPKWSAPELNNGTKVNKIREATDLYSIGAILFERIFGRCPDANDRFLIKKNKIDINQDSLKGLSIKEIEKLTNILKRTLCDVEKRYQHADNLVEDLNKLIKILNLKQPLPQRRVPDKNNILAGLLAIFLGWCGAHWFYSKRPLRAIIYMSVYFLGFGFPWILYMIEGVVFICSKRAYEKYRRWYMTDFIKKLKKSDD